uniref:Cytochrome P450 CYP71-1 n=1 Tax=Daphne genkwa TaxID=1477590 RepID=A0A977LF23_9ROSI|nr:cytochrome P450 CYP71-1 [Daphne genkwa]
MEPLHVPMSTPAVLFTFLCVVLAFFKLWSKLSGGHKNLPPGPRKLPVIGNIHNLAAGGPLAHRTLKQLADTYGPIMHLQLGQISTVVVSTPEMAKEVMKTKDANFAQRPQSIAAHTIFYNCTDMVFTHQVEYGRELRKICVMELLNQKRVLSFRPIRQEESVNLIRGIASSTGKPVNVRASIRSMSYKVIARALIGRRAETDERYIQLTKEVVELLGGFNLAESFPSFSFLPRITGLRSRLDRIQNEINGILDGIITEHMELRKKSTSDITGAEEDILHVLLDLQEQNKLEFPLTRDSIKANLQAMILAGIDTASTAIEWAFIELMKNPALRDKATKELRDVFGKQGKVDEAEFHKLEYLKLVIKETLRKHPSAPLLIPRESIEECEIKGYNIPAKTRVIINAWAISTNPKYWEDPDTFKPERFLDNERTFDYRGNQFEYLPFGSGRRMCPGVAMGLTNVELGLANLLFNFDWKLPEGQRPEDLSLSENFGLSVGRKEDLYAIPIPYTP